MASTPRRLWALRRDRPLFVAVSVATILTLLAWLPVEHHLRDLGVGLSYTFNDFSAYTEALNRWLDGSAMYVPQDGGGYFGEYLYPPVTILVFYPFETTGFDVGAALFGFTAIVLLWVGLETVALAVASLAIFGLETNLQYLDVLIWGNGWGETKAHYAWTRPRPTGRCTSSAGSACT